MPSTPGERNHLNHRVIDTLVELERSAARVWWESEDRTAWRDDLLRRLDTHSPLQFKAFLNQACGRPEIFAWDDDLLQCFSPATQITETRTFDDLISKIHMLKSNQVLGLIPRPGFWLTESWHEEEDLLRQALAGAKEKQSLVVRCGFLTQQSDVLMAADLGFSGVQIHADGLDLFELQLLIELARDCRISPIVSISNRSQVETVLQTDAPHIALCCLAGESYEESIRFVQEALPGIPANCTKILIASAFEEREIANLGRLGFQSVMTIL